MKQHLMRIVGWLRRDPDISDESERKRRRGELAGMIYGALLAVVGLGWLVTATDLALLRAEWPTLLFMLILAALLNRLDFFWIVERRAGTYERWSAPLGGLVTTSAALLFGPTAVWSGVIVCLISYAYAWRTTPLAVRHWGMVGHLLLNLSCCTLGYLLGLALYQRLGGVFPLPGLTWPAAPLAFLAVLVLLSFDWLCWSCYLLLVRWTGLNRAGAWELGLFAKFELLAYLPEFFAVLAAAVYSQMGLGGYLFLIAGALLVSTLAQRLSRAAERSRQRSRELAQLEQLGRAIIAAPPDASTLPEVLAAFVPPMFRHEQIEIRLFSGQTLLCTPAQAPTAPAALWDWLRAAPRLHTIGIGAALPWSDQPATHALAVAPIVSINTAEPLGGICVTFSLTVDDPAEALPALQSLAAQIASALYRAEEYARALAHQKVTQELAVAAEIQASFLPAALPHIDGWQLAATLRPARQTSGDFYDLMELPDGRLGILIADVTDKGTGAALFMALSRTLIRTYAFEYPDRPEKVLYAANKRILTDTRTNMFVTAFYGILDPRTGTLTYCNAGHNPPYLVRADNGTAPQELHNTGIPIGITTEARWEARTVEIAPGDLLVLYTDGISEAHNQQRELFDARRLLASIQANLGLTALAVQAAILAAVDQFVGAAPQSDDQTLLVVVRECGDSRAAGQPSEAESQVAAGPSVS
jgi:serine phosphatase RsbU (regulator of sigma subunit)